MVKEDIKRNHYMPFLRATHYSVCFTHILISFSHDPGMKLLSLCLITQVGKLRHKRLKTCPRSQRQWVMEFKPSRLSLGYCFPHGERTACAKGLCLSEQQGTGPLQARQAPSGYHIKSFPILTPLLPENNSGVGNVLHLVLAERHHSRC